MVGRSAEIEQVLADIEQVAQARSTVLVTGEPGTGKELVAKTIHFASPRAERPFLALNCAALPEHLIESELFGIEDHVATGVRHRPGIFERADGGTLFLDEIGDMPLGVQAKLLRVLQEREITRVGGAKVIRVDVRLIAATNKVLPDLIRRKEFRDDLYHRVNTLTIQVPRLRDRKADIPLLAEHFLQRYCEENGRPVPRIPAALLASLLKYHWPGNVRELQNYIERCVVMSRGGVLETRIPLGEDDPVGPDDVSDRRLAPNVGQGSDLKAARSTMERELILKALQDTQGNQRRAAAVLGMAEPTLRYRMKLLDIPARHAPRAKRPRKS
jgi:DNA-binding NtrC family response regulator